MTPPDGERAYHYEFPNGEIFRAAIRQSDLASHVVQIEAQISPKMICLSERRDEFREALRCGKDNRFDVYADWNTDAFVVNQDNKAEYRVKLETHQKQLFVECEYPDFNKIKFMADNLRGFQKN